MELDEILQKIDSLKKEIDSLRPIDPETEKRIWQKFRLDWNFHSNNLEGNSLTYGETKSFLLHGITAQGKPLKDHLDIKGHNDAILMLDDIVKQKRPLTEVFIRGIHEIILSEPYERPAVTAEGKPTTKRIEIGKYKKSANHVQTATGEIFYFASPEETPALMNDLLDWYQKAIAKPDYHPLLIAAEFHYRFVRIHPFDDGNGRMARILMNLILMQAGFTPVIIKTDDKANYYRALQLADSGELTAFFVYIGERLISSEELFVKGARGGDIQELDDIDKEISLLKAQLAQESQKIIYDKNTVKEIMVTSIRAFFDVLSSKLNQFDELFNRKEIIWIGLHQNGSEYFSEIKYSFYDLLNEFTKSQISKSHIKIYEFQVIWKDFIKTEDKIFNVHIAFRLVFNSHNFEIKIGESVVEQFPYHRIDDKKNNMVATQLAKAVLEEIKEHLRE